MPSAANAIGASAIGAAAGAIIGSATGQAGPGRGDRRGHGPAVRQRRRQQRRLRVVVQLQQRYDGAYMQCMYAKGNQIPVRMSGPAAYRNYSGPPAARRPANRSAAARTTAALVAALARRPRGAAGPAARRRLRRGSAARFRYNFKLLHAAHATAPRSPSWNSPRASSRTRSKRSGTRCGRRAAISRRPARPARRAFCIQLPPPNVTGTLHMGHAFQQTLMDVLTRYHRMRGYNTLWQLGTDHAGIATQIVVENQLRGEGTSRRDLGREQFVERVWAWKEESGSTITRQMRRLGTSGDWSRERFTMDEGLSAAVLETFVRLHEDGLIYRGKRLVNWDPEARHRGVRPRSRRARKSRARSGRSAIRSPTASGSLVVATTRPGDDAGRRRGRGESRRRALPRAGRQAGDAAADRPHDPGHRRRLRRQEFGTGCVKITPAHDFNDWQIGQRHGLAPITILNLDAKVNDNAPGEVSRPRPLRRAQGGARGPGRRRACSSARRRTRWWCRAASAPARSSSRCSPTSGSSRRRVAAPATHPFFPGQLDPGPLPRRGGRRSRQSAHRRARAASSSCPTSGCRPTCTGSTTSRTGASRASSGGATGSRRGTTTPATSTSRATKPRRAAQARAKLGREPRDFAQDEDVLDTWFSSALWCHSTLGWPQDTPRAADVPAVVGAGHRLRHHLLLGRADGDDDDLLHRRGPVPRRLHQRAGARRGRPEDVEVEGQHARSARPDRRRRPRHAGRQAHVRADAREASARRSRSARASSFPNGIPAFGADALRFTFAALATLQPHAQLRPATAARATATSATSCGTPRASC